MPVGLCLKIEITPRARFGDYGHVASGGLGALSKVHPGVQGGRLSRVERVRDLVLGGVRDLHILAHPVQAESLPHFAGGEASPIHQRAVVSVGRVIVGGVVASPPGHQASRHWHRTEGSARSRWRFRWRARRGKRYRGSAQREVLEHHLDLLTTPTGGVALQNQGQVI